MPWARARNVPEARDLVIFTFGNGVPMSRRRRARDRRRARLEGARGRPALAAAAQHRGDRAPRRRVRAHHRGRRRPPQRRCGRRHHHRRRRGWARRQAAAAWSAPTPTPPAGAAFAVIPADADIVAAAARLPAWPGSRFGASSARRIVVPAISVDAPSGLAGPARASARRTKRRAPGIPLRHAR